MPHTRRKACSRQLASQNLLVVIILKQRKTRNLPMYANTVKQKRYSFLTLSMRNRFSKHDFFEHHVQQKGHIPLRSKAALVPSALDHEADWTYILYCFNNQRISLPKTPYRLLLHNSRFGKAALIFELWVPPFSLHYSEQIQCSHLA